MEFKEFRPGKKYRQPGWRDGVVIAVVGFDNDVPVVRSGSGNGNYHLITAYSDYSMFIEYREPREFLIAHKEDYSYVVQCGREVYENKGYEVIKVREILE